MSFDDFSTATEADPLPDADLENNIYEDQRDSPSRVIQFPYDKHLETSELSTVEACSPVYFRHIPPKYSCSGTLSNVRP